MSANQDVPTQLAEQGIEVAGRVIISIPMIQDLETSEVKPVSFDEPVGVRVGHDIALVLLPPVAELLQGQGTIDGDPMLSPVATPFMASLETTAALYCQVTGRRPTDDAFIKLYKALKDSPDGRPSGALAGYLQAAARAYVAIHPTSKAEYKAIVGRLLRSAKTFRESKRSANYLANSLTKFAELD